MSTTTGKQAKYAELYTKLRWADNGTTFECQVSDERAGEAMRNAIKDWARRNRMAVQVWLKNGVCYVHKK